MPPWLPEHGFGDFADELRLSDDQIRSISAWLRAGTPPNSSAAESASPSHARPQTGTWPLGTPDLVLTPSNPFEVPADGTDVFWNFVLNPDLSRTRYVRAIDIHPSNPRTVHHANLIIDRLGSYTSDFAGMDISVTGTPLDIDGHALFWKPGTVLYSEPPGMAWRLDPGNRLILNVHMQPSGKQVAEKPVIGHYFTDERPTRFPYLLELEYDGALEIPAGDPNFVITDTFRLPIDTQIVAIYPHAHYLGELLQAWATLPDHTRQWLIRIPDWI